MIETSKKVVKKSLGIVELFFGGMGFLILLGLFILYPPLFIIVMIIVVVYVIKVNKSSVSKNKASTISKSDTTKLSGTVKFVMVIACFCAIALSPPIGIVLVICVILFTIGKW